MGHWFTEKTVFFPVLQQTWIAVLHFVFKQIKNTFVNKV